MATFVGKSNKYLISIHVSYIYIYILHAGNAKLFSNIPAN